VRNLWCRDNLYSSLKIIANLIEERPFYFLVVCSLLCYATALNSPFQFDDINTIFGYRGVHSFGAWVETLSSSLRPLLKLTYLFNWALSTAPLGFHIFNITVHIINVILVYQFSMEVSRGILPPLGDAAKYSALIAAFLFAVHPVNTEAVTYISGRSASLMTLCYIASALCYMRGVRLDKPIMYAFSSPFLFLVAVLIKETALTLPLALLLWEVVIKKTKISRIGLRQIIFWLLVMGMLCLAVTNDRYYAMLDELAGSRSLVEAMRYQIHGIAYLISRLVLINRLCINPELGKHPPGELLLVSEICILILMAVVGLLKIRKYPEVTLGILWFFLHLLLPYIILSRTEVINERHMYIANVGLFCAIGTAITSILRTSQWNKIVLTILGAVSCIFVVQTNLRNLEYHTELALWQSTVRISTASSSAYNNLGVAYHLAGRDSEAALSFEHALFLDPDDETARQNLRRLLAIKAIGQTTTD